MCLMSFEAKEKRNLGKIQFFMFSKYLRYLTSTVVYSRHCFFFLYFMKLNKAKLNTAYLATKVLGYSNLVYLIAKNAASRV